MKSQTTPSTTPAPTPTSTNSEFLRSLAELKAFNPAIIYGFDTERPALKHAKTQLSRSLHVAGQYKDMLKAYLYAQNEILPTLRQGKEKITPKHWETWIKKIHGHIAYTMGLDTNNVSGLYRVDDCGRWNPDAEVQKELTNYFMKRSSRQDLMNFAKRKKLDLAAFEIFVALLERLGNDQTLVLAERRQAFLKHMRTSIPAAGAISSIIEKLYQCLQQNTFLSAEERKAADQFIDVPADPEELPGLMRQFCEALNKQFLACDSQNTDQLLDFIYFAFFNNTEIHPFWNGNGRTATCLINTLLVFFGKPSILLRYPDERLNPKNSYSLAVNHLKAKPQYFKDHVKERIEEKTPYTNAPKLKHAAYRVGTQEILEKVKKQIPEEKLEALLEELERKSAAVIPPSMISIKGNQLLSISEEVVAVMDQYIYEQLALAFSPALQNIEEQAKKRHLSSEITKRTTSPDEMDKIVEALEAMTAQTRIKAFQPKNPLVLIYLTTERIASEVKSRLAKTEAMQITITTDATTRQPVLKLENINLSKLLLLLPEKINGVDRVFNQG